MLSFQLAILITFVAPILSVLPDDDSSCFNQCFHQPQEACPPHNIECRCRQLPNCKEAAICCGVDLFTLREGISCGNLTKRIKALHIRGASFDVLDLSDTQFARVWKSLLYLSITDGKIVNITGHFSKQTQIHCLNLSSNALNSVGDVKDRTLANLFNLNYLDMSNNNITEIPRFKKDGNITLDVSNNKNVSCNSLKSLLLSKPDEVKFNNENETLCQYMNDFGFFNAREVLPFQQLRKSVEVQKNCIHNCTCTSHRLVVQAGHVPYFEVAVNCWGKNFSSLPVPLPDNTVSLNVSYNHIQSLKEFAHSSYHSLRYFFADDNEITSMQPLEGTKFISSFDILSLANNKIRIFETYLLDNIHFDRNWIHRSISLGGNRIYCDCNTLKLKNWLASKARHIPDHSNITCDNINMKVMELDSTKLCQSPQDWTDYIYYIITGEVLLLVGLVAKVSYDYWVFKTAGYLPWPASKMPRLPCDWLCE